VKYDYTKAKFFDTGISMISKYDPYEDRILFGHALASGLSTVTRKLRLSRTVRVKPLPFTRRPWSLHLTAMLDREPFWFGAFRQGEQATEARVEVALRRLPKPTGDFDDERQ